MGNNDLDAGKRTGLVAVTDRSSYKEPNYSCLTSFLISAETAEGVFAAIKQVLQPGGMFAFTVEEHQGEGWSVGPSGRFRHSRAYLETLRDELDYTASSFERIVLRHDGGEPCQGFVIAWSAEPETASPL